MERGNITQAILAALALNGRLTAVECARIVHQGTPSRKLCSTVASLLNKLALRSMVRRYAQLGKPLEYGPAPRPRAVQRQPVSLIDPETLQCQATWSRWFATDLAAAA